MATPSYQDIIEKDIFELLDLQQIPAAEREELATKLYNTIENRVILRLDTIMEAADVEAWKKYLEAGDRQGADAFLLSKQIDIQKILIEEAAILKAQVVFMLKGEAPATTGGTPGTPPSNPPAAV